MFYIIIIYMKTDKRKLKVYKRKLKAYKKTNVYPFLSKMYKIFNTKPDLFTLQKLHNYQGICDWEEDSIKIDYRKEFISTIVHEVLHYIHPNWSESKVLREETKIMNSLSFCQIRRILQRFVQFL